MSFEENKYVVIKNAISEETVKMIQFQSQMLEDVICHNNHTLPKFFNFSDKQVPNSFSYYGALFTESMMLLLQPILEKHTGKQLLPTYSYMRIYYENSTLAKHTDRPSCEYSATVCIQCDAENPWPIQFEDIRKQDVSVILREGDMAIYKGDELVHWRDECKYNKHIQVFLHYVDANGKYADFKYDKRIMLGIKR